MIGMDDFKPDKLPIYEINAFQAGAAAGTKPLS